MLIRVAGGKASGSPVTEDNFRLLYPNTVFPPVLTNEVVAPYGFEMYDFSQIPDVGPYQKLVEDEPRRDAFGIWRQTWRVQSLTGAELATRKAQLQDQRWEEIKRLRDAKTQRGGFPLDGKWFHSDTFSRSQHYGLMLAASQLLAGGASPADPMPGVPPWKTMDGSFVTLTPASVLGLLPKAMKQDGDLFSHAEVLKAQVYAADDPLSVDITAGWPATYAGA